MLQGVDVHKSGSLAGSATERKRQNKKVNQTHMVKVTELYMNKNFPTHFLYLRC